MMTKPMQMNSIRKRRLKLKLYQRQRGACEYCGNKFPITVMTFDHIIRRRDGGGSGQGNLVLACGPCNNYREHSQGMNLKKLAVQHRRLVDGI